MAEFKDVMKKYKEMCDSCGPRCTGCPLNKLTAEHDITCSAFLKNYPKEAEEVIMAWEEPVDWSEVKVDTKILVRTSENNDWQKRYFAKFEDGKVYAWMYGATSWSADSKNDIMAWVYAKLVEEGDENDE